MVRVTVRWQPRLWVNLLGIAFLVGSCVAAVYDAGVYVAMLLQGLGFGCEVVESRRELHAYKAAMQQMAGELATREVIAQWKPPQPSEVLAKAQEVE